MKKQRSFKKKRLTGDSMIVINTYDDETITIQVNDICTPLFQEIPFEATGFGNSYLYAKWLIKNGYEEVT
ncbi:hypothetical protein [Listeria ilorinensis]|uniref:hypothetical protein n=1 Tax=Listeria ilorinensis TaxID=2867439 RepID=UPI001EF5BCAE|nr:hypothetical protein [Listeria ilorinensis]